MVVATVEGPFNRTERIENLLFSLNTISGGPCCGRALNLPKHQALVSSTHSLAMPRRDGLFLLTRIPGTLGYRQLSLVADSIPLLVWREGVGRVPLPVLPREFFLATACNCHGYSRSQPVCLQSWDLHHDEDTSVDDSQQKHTHTPCPQKRFVANVSARPPTETATTRSTTMSGDGRPQLISYPSRDQRSKSGDGESSRFSVGGKFALS